MFCTVTCVEWKWVAEVGAPRPSPRRAALRAPRGDAQRPRGARSDGGLRRADLARGGAVPLSARESAAESVSALSE